MTDRPLHATECCRHYDYVAGRGAVCARGFDLSGFTVKANACLPPAMTKGVICGLREEFTSAERVAWQAWRADRMEAMAKIMVEIPGSSRDKKKRDGWGQSGSFGCPACDWGVVRWSRAPNNGHLAAACSTPGCFSVME